MRVQELQLTRLGQAEAVDSLGEIVHADVLRFAAVLKELLCGRTGASDRASVSHSSSTADGLLTRMMAWEREQRRMKPICLNSTPMTSESSTSTSMDFCFQHHSS